MSFSRTESGFTLIELMVVLVILGLLATIVGPRVIGQQDKAMRVKAQTTIAALETGLKMYKLDMGRYPASGQGLAALVACPSGDNCDNWQKGGYLDKQKVPKDPWKNDYIYLYPGVHNNFDIISYGADGTSGGQDDNADINSWDLE